MWVESNKLPFFVKRNRKNEGVAIDRQALPPANGEISRAKGKKNDGLRPLIAAEIFKETGDEVAPGGHPSVNFVGDQVDLPIVNLPVQFLQFIEMQRPCFFPQLTDHMDVFRFAVDVQYSQPLETVPGKKLGSFLLHFNQFSPAEGAPFPFFQGLL